MILLICRSMIDSCIPAMAMLRGPVPFVHLLLNCYIREGGHVVDATCGNGHDTLLLAHLTGTGGHVWGFDNKQQAIAQTSCRLAEAGMLDRVTLLQIGHEDISQHVSAPVQAILFNLGYLPGGERSIITRPETTIPALEKSLQLLAVAGILLVTIYPGHNGGTEEQAAVESWFATLDPHKTHCWRMAQTKSNSGVPCLLLAQRAL